MKVIKMRCEECKYQRKNQWNEKGLIKGFCKCTGQDITFRNSKYRSPKWCPEKKKDKKSNKPIFLGGGYVVIGATNNWRKLHGINIERGRKCFPHERKDIPKKVRVKYHQMKKVGCDNELIYKHTKPYYNPEEKKRRK